STCSFTVLRWDGTNCDGPPTSSPKTDPICYYLNSATESSFTATPVAPGNTACAPQNPTAPAGDVGACEVTGGTCSGGGACVPRSFPKIGRASCRERVSVSVGDAAVRKN